MKTLTLKEKIKIITMARNTIQKDVFCFACNHILFALRKYLNKNGLHSGDVCLYFPELGAYSPKEREGNCGVEWWPGAMLKPRLVIYDDLLRRYNYCLKSKKSFKSTSVHPNYNNETGTLTKKG